MPWTRCGDFARSIRVLPTSCDGKRLLAASNHDAVVVISVSISGKELADFDSLVEHFGYDSRSSAVRDALYHFVAKHRLDMQKAGEVVLTLVYDSESSQDTVRDKVHRHEDLVQTSLHQHVGSKCVDVLVVQGDADGIHGLLDDLTKVKDVRVNMSII